MKPQDNLHFSASGCLDFLWPVLAAFRIPPTVREQLTQAARKLAPVPRIALELRLNESKVPPDLHQMAVHCDEDRDALAAFLTTHATHNYPPLTASFVQRWGAGDPGEKDSPHIFFEWDFQHLNAAPAVFLPIDAKGSGGVVPSQRASQLRALMDLAGKTTQSDEEKPWSNIPFADDCSISHIGAMSATRGDVVRLNYRGIRPGQLQDLLKRIQWPGDVAYAVSLFNEFVELADTVTVALNFEHGHAGAGIGFEVMFDEPIAFEPRYAQLFQRLCELRVCTAEEAACLLQTGAQIYPYAARQDWPTAWIVVTELREGNAVPRVERALSHVKLSLAETGFLSAKAYVSAQLHWSDAPAPELTRSDRTLEGATNAAVSFLLTRQHQNGWWTEFRTKLGPSDEWTTAFVAYALVGSDDDEALRAARDSVDRLLSRERPGGGWGYNASAPADADTTAWVLRLFERVDFAGPAKQRALLFLAKHVSPNGLVSTYDPFAPIEFQSGDELVSDKGWKAGHLCVTANAAPLLGANALRALYDSQEKDGSWIPYWWRTPVLVTALATDTLAGTNEYASAVAKAVRWARSFAAPAPSAWIDAWRICILAHGDAEAQEYGRGLAQNLMDLQLEDGGFPSGADLKIPESHDTEGGTAPDMAYERDRLFTTAAALMAIRLPYLKTLTSGEGGTSCR